MSPAVSKALLLVAGAASAGLARGNTDPCPTDSNPYGSEASPFGWPITPMDWAFSREDCWESAHQICGGERQSPMDIDMAHGAAWCDTSKTGPAGILAARADYLRLSDQKVRLSEYMGTAMVAGQFGKLELTENGEEVTFDATQVHLAAPSLHTINGSHFDAEMLVLHKPRGHPDMLQKGVIVSVMFKIEEGQYSPIFENFGFDKDHGRENSAFGGPAFWSTVGGVDIVAETSRALQGPSYSYDGSVPVPPCSENVKWIIMGSAQPVSEEQISHLRNTLSVTRGGATHRGALPHNRCVSVNTPEVGGDHSELTCSNLESAGSWKETSRCWKFHDRCWSKQFAAVDIRSMDAIEPSEEHPIQDIRDIAHYKPTSSISMSPAVFTLDAHVDNHGDFGHLRLNGHIYFAKNISFKAISHHALDGVRHAGELVIEHVMYGDTFGEGMPHFHEDFHRVMVSIPLKLGAPNVLLGKLDLSESAGRAIREGLAYKVDRTIDLQAELASVFDGRWFWFSSNSTHPDCGAPVKWMLFENSLDISIEQLNLLKLPISGVDSTEVDSINPLIGTVFRQHLPDFAVESNETECENLPQFEWKYGAFSPSWNYGNERCWELQFPICGDGMMQSPIDIPVSDVEMVGEDHFLNHVSWKPVSGLRVANTGHGLQVTSSQLGYMSLINDEGFPDYYQIAQFHLHMPSEHLIGGKQYAAELHVVHQKQNTVGDLADDDMLVTGIMFDFGEESHVLKQLFLSNNTQAPKEERAFLEMPHPFDPMRAFGPAIDGPFYRYNGGLTTPPCSEVVKWFVFENAMTLSMEQWLAFKELFPNPTNNRPVQAVNGREVRKNSMMQGTPNEFDFYLNREQSRDRAVTNPALIVAPILGTVLLCTVVMAGIFVREDRSRKSQSAGGLEGSTIGKSTFNKGVYNEL